jgi:hypothetical protein
MLLLFVNNQLIDVEIERPEVKSLLVPDNDSQQ